MRIAYLVTRADPIGGAQIHVRDLAVAMQGQGHAPLVLTGGDGPFLDELRQQRIPTVVLPNLTVPIHPLKDLRALRDIRAQLGAFGAELVAAHSSKAGVLGRIAGRSVGLPVVLTVHGWSFTPGIPAIQAAVYRQIERLAGPLATRIITVSEFDRQLGLRARIAPADRLVTVYNGMPDVPHTLRADPGRSPVRLVMVARFGAQKDHATLLSALAGLREHAWELDLVGDGPLRESIHARARELGVADRVHFLGQRMDVERILARAQVSLLVTNWEGFPLSILEAMRAGLPVVASAVGGIPESVRQGETGFLVPRGDAAQLRTRVGQLIASAELRTRLGANGRALYEREFTLDQTVARTLAVYRHALGRGRAVATAHQLETPARR